MMRITRVISLVLLPITMVLVPPVLNAADGDEAQQAKPLEERNLWRLEWDNDAFVHTDNGFTDGWSLQRHSPTRQGWEDMGLSGFSSWISRTVPGLGDAGGRIVRRGRALTQVMMTPEDVSNPEPQPGDVPWAGALGWSESWYAYDNKRLNAFQIYGGILGPYSLAETFQVHVHDWINADDPLGWDNQLKTEPLVNINYCLKRKIHTHGEYADGFASDISIGGHAGLGNFSTFAEATLEFRLGWGLPKGFVHTPDPPGRGITIDPVMGVPDRIYFYFSIVARISATAYTVFFDGNTFTESPHPGLDYDTVSRGAVFGFHMATRRFAVHLNLNSYSELPFESVNPLTDMTWGNITFEYRF